MTFVHTLLRATLAVAALVAAPAFAQQDYPQRPVRLLVPYGANGGGPDFVARAVADKLRVALGQPVVLDNRPGAAGVLGTSAAAKAAPDGYTVLVGDTGPLAIQPGLRKDLGFDPEKDFIPVSNGITAPLFFVVNTSSGIHDMKELVARLKAQPNLSYGSTGVGSVHHLAMEQFLSRTGTRMTHIPYTTQAQSVPAILAGDIAVLVVAYPNVRAHIAAGKLKALAVASGRRAPFAADVPTVAESAGLRDYDVGIDVGFLVPAGTPPDIVNKLNGHLQATLKSPEVADKLMGAGLIPIPGTAAEYAAKIRADRAVFKSVIAETGVQVQ